jgi:hypothetical protein
MEASQRKLAGKKECSTVRKKPAVNKARKADQKKKKPGASSPQKEPSTSHDIATGQMTTCYRTIAEAYDGGRCVGAACPSMFMEVGATTAWLAGELANKYTCILGVGRIQTECLEGQSYGGFDSAEVASTVPGTMFQAQKTDPKVGRKKAGPRCPIEMKDGDVICTFKGTTLNLIAEEFVHLMRRIPESTVATLKTQGMWNPLGPEDSEDSVCCTVWKIGSAMDAV